MTMNNEHTLLIQRDTISYARPTWTSISTDSPTWMYPSYLLYPLLASLVLGAIRPSVRHVIVLEQVQKWITKWTPLFLDVVSVLQHRDSEDRPVVRSAYLGDTNGPQSGVAAFLESATTSKPSTRTRLGEPTLSLSTEVPHVPKHEKISDSPSLVLSQGKFANPEFALGRVRGALDEHYELLHEHAFCLSASISESSLDVKSRWIIGSDTWSYDLGASGIHHATVSGLSVNTLILDTLPYTARNSSDPTRRKHDISDYSTAFDLLKETKLAVDSGYWPLYRWDPSKEAAGNEPFSLDSDAIKNDLQAFLDHQNHLFQLRTSKGGASMPDNKAKRLVGRAQVRGLSATIATMDTMDIDALSREEHVWFVTSTAGLGAKLSALGNERIAELGLGDDQDADGAETGYKVWEPLVWKALGADLVEAHEAEPEPITNEHIKAASSYLRGTIAEGLEDTSTGALAASDTQLTKFHGIYQQDDRDIRDEREAQGVEVAYSFMIRVRLPGGVCTTAQWLAMDQIADEHGTGHFKLTTRQTFQFHGVIKKHLKPSIQAINRALLDTLAACGDVNRTTAYREIWLDKKLVAGEALKDFEPLYGEFYLPRKFKIVVAVPRSMRSTSLRLANDVGYIALVNEREQGQIVAEKIMLVQRDNGNWVECFFSCLICASHPPTSLRSRKNACLKYTIGRMGLDVFKAEVENLLGFQFQPAQAYGIAYNTLHWCYQTYP
ncbi:hypothetical protein V8E53_005157 [Lactarius tabidus]